MSLANDTHASSSSSGSVLNNHIKSVDGLRAVAVLSVLIYHAFPKLLPGGFVGVDIFFVISGFVVSGSLYRQKYESLKSLLQGFYLRRIVRIVPPLVACLAFTFLLAKLFIPRPFFWTSASLVGSGAFLGLGNIAQFLSYDSYFSPTSEYNAYIHTWSLGVEEQFYFIFPLLFFFWRSNSVKQSAWSWISRLVFPGLCLLSLAEAVRTSHANPTASYYLLQSRFWELATGVLLQIALRRMALSPNRIHTNVAFALGTALLALSLWQARESNFPYPWAIPPVIGTVLLIFASCIRSDSDLLVPILENPVSQYLGAISYSLYLWHWPVLALFRWTLGLESIHAIVAIVLIFGLAAASYKFIEIPTRSFNSKFRQKPVPFILGSVACLGLAAVGSFGFDRYAGRLALSQTKDDSLWGWRHPQVMDAPPKPTPGRKPILYCMGDSHAIAYYYMLEAYKKQTGRTVVLDHVRPFFNLREMTLDKPDGQAGLARLLASVQAGDVVFVPALRTWRYCDQWGPVPGPEEASEEVKSQRYQEGLFNEFDDFLGQMARKGVYVVVDDPKPILKSPPFRCVDWFNQSNPSCREGFEIPRAELMARSEPIRKKLDRLQARHPNLVRWDIFSLLCPGETCGEFLGGKPIFYDGDHMTRATCERLAPYFTAKIEQIMARPLAIKL